MSKIIHNLKEFLAWRGFAENEARYWARCFYKYVACGPWAVFLMKDQPAYDIDHADQVARIRKDGRYVRLTNPDELTEEFVRLLGFDEHGLSKRQRWWGVYNKLVDDFIAEEKAGGKPHRCIQIQSRTKTELDILLPGWTEPVEASVKEIYYEDIGPQYEWRNGECPCVEDGKADPECPRCEGKGAWYGRYPTGEVITVEPDECVGIKFGSIVEGSEVCSGPFTHMFPFDTADFERDENYMEEETEYYWIRDNSRWYVLQVRDRTYYLRNTWGDIVWEEKPSPKLSKKVEAYIHEHWETIPHEPGYWAQPGASKDWKPARIPNSVSDIYETCNDSVL